MADKSKLNVFTRTGPGDEPNPELTGHADLDRGNIRQTGVGLRQGEMDALTAIGNELGGIARNALIRFAVRRFIMQYRAGKVDLSDYVETPPEPKKKLRMP